MMDRLINKFHLCHRMSERSFHYKGKQFPVCARCRGLLLGYCVLPLFYFGLIKIPFLFLILLFIPIILDVISQYFGLRESNNKLRLFTGILASFAVSGLTVFLSKIILTLF